ncbi:hypothetical protein QOZ80_6AG0538420 [Eleusine coracana subsp. coracana]|nr:hypothetical protein QOZ80_6AG0538420 [Eleusine coracana subsp. coracana]
MGTEVAALVDLQALTQSDLVALAEASPYAVDPRRGRRRDANFLPPPKIDRSVFNESAGSRKQTFSRHRPGTNVSHSLTPPAASSSATASAPTEEDSENRLIVFHLQSLFARDDPSYPLPAPIPPRPQTLTAPAVTASAPQAPSLPQPSQAADPDREVINPKGTAVDLVRLAELVDPYGEELQKRTAGLGSEPELLGYMNSLEGQWGSRRRRRKFVDASMFGDHLPRGWKLLLGLKRKERVAWINCRRYVSPKGHQFATCKEVASYLMSVLGYPEAKLTAIHSNSATVHGSNAVHFVDLQQQTDPTVEKQIAMPVTSVTLFNHSGDSHQQKLQKDETPVGVSVRECQKCSLTFNDQGAYMQHQLSFHQRKAKRCRVSKFDELGASMDGKFETQECQKTSNEGPGSFSHGVAESYEGQSAANLFHGSFSGELGGKPSMAAVQRELQPMTALPQQEKEPSVSEPVPGNHKDPLIKRTDFPELKKGPAAGQPTSDHHQDPVDKPGDCKNNDEACQNTVTSLGVDAESKFSTCNSADIHENDISNKLENPSKDSSQIFNRPDETCSIPVSPTAYGPDESKCTDDPVGCTDATQSKQVSEPCDLLHGNFGSSREENNLNNQLESKPFSVTLDERDLNSVEMEVDGASIACNAAHSPNIENEKPVEDRIMGSEMTSLKDVEIKSRIRDVNLNSCLDNISSPVSGGNYDTSNTTDDATRSSILAQCFGSSSNDDNTCKDGNLANQNRSSKGEKFVEQKNDMVYQSNLTMGPIPPAQINVDCFTSEIKNYGNRSEDNSKEALVNSRNMMSNETGFDVEAYNNDIFNGTITESSLAQLNNAINMKNDFASCYSLSDLNTLTGGTATDEIDIHGMRNSFVGSTSRDEPNEHSTLDFDIKGSMLEALQKSDSDLENQYSGAGPTCDSLPAAGTSGNIDDFMSMQTNFGSFTSLVRAVEDVPLSIIQDQCDLQLGFGGPKQPIYPSFEQQLRMASAGAPPYGGMRHDSVPVPEPTLMLGYAPQLGSCPPFQLGWGSSFSKMGPGCVLRSVCVWCNSQFQHFGSVAEQQQADSLGYICPSCKGKFSGHLGINGPSL